MKLTPYEIARICHEANRAYCIAVGDNLQPPFDNAPEWQKDSAIKGVEAHLSNSLSPRESHELWLSHKESEGWVYGPVKDVDNKQHPCMVSYDELPEEQQLKDKLFSAIVGVFK